MSAHSGTMQHSIAIPSFYTTNHRRHDEADTLDLRIKIRACSLGPCSCASVPVSQTLLC